MGIGRGLVVDLFSHFSILCLIHECFLVFMFGVTRKGKKNDLSGQEFRDLCFSESVLRNYIFNI